MLTLLCEKILHDFLDILHKKASKSHVEFSKKFQK